MNTFLALIPVFGGIGFLALCYGLLYLAVYKMLFIPNIARYKVPQDPLGQDWEDMKPFKTLLEKEQSWYYSQKKEDLWMTSYDGLKLYAELIRTVSADEKGTVICVHGWHGMALRDFAPVYRTFCENGYNILMIDQRSHGKSEGQWITFGIRERFDVRDWITCINEKLGNNLPVFLYGISLGCSTVLMTTGFELPENVKGVIADCGFTSPYDEMAYLMDTSYHLPKWPILSIADSITRKYAGFGIKEYSTLKAMETNVTPILFVNGDADTFVPPFMTEKAYNACKADKERLIVKGAPHSISNCVDQKGYLAAALDFLRRFST